MRDLCLGDERIEFSARFGGRPFQVSVPTRSVLAIVARENGAGMSFPIEEPDAGPPDDSSGERPGKPSLRLVK